MKLDLGCGPWKAAGYIGVDINAYEGVDIIADLMKLPWQWADGEVEEIRMSHFLEHFIIPLDDVLRECHRVICTNGVIRIILPNLRGSGAFDPGHTLYLDESWFKKNELFNSLFDIISITRDRNFIPQENLDACAKLSELTGIDRWVLDTLLWNTFHQVEIVARKK